MFHSSVRRWSFLFVPCAVACSTPDKADGQTSASAETADGRIYCTLEYTDVGHWATGPISSGQGDFSHGVIAFGDGYTLWLWVSTPATAANPYLTTFIELEGPNGRLGYTLVPSSVFKQGEYAFEMSANIPTVTADGADGQKHDFTALRAYCSLGSPNAPAPPVDGGASTADTGASTSTSDADADLPADATAE